MNGVPASEIKFFHLSSRIGRLRYFVYPLGLLILVLPVLILALVLVSMHHLLLGELLLLLTEIFIPINVVFMIRRLHDLDRGGWWTLIYAAMFPFPIFSIFFGKLGGALLAVYLLVMLVNLGFILMLLFTRGTDGDNRFGPPPPPNSGWIIFGAWAWLIVPFFGGILAAIAIPAYQDYMARSQTSEGIQLAGAAEVPVAEYYQKNKIWPMDLSSLYGGADRANSVGRFVATVTPIVSVDGSFGVIATMKQSGVNRLIAGKSLELWTNDGGATWHCGPASSNPVDPKFLPVVCRDNSPSPP